MTDLLTNFEAGDGLIDFKPKFKGGTWKQRLQIKKGRQLYAKQKDDTESRDPAVVEEPSPKRARRDFEYGKAASNEQDERIGQFSVERPRASTGKEVISSLFSYNPESKTTATQTEQSEQKDFAPSNAPLDQNIDSFTSLGVSSMLATHLMTKMAVNTPTSIQKEAIPLLLNKDSDAFIQSQTGSGKTLAYLLPLVQRLMDFSYKSTTQNTAPQKIHRDSGLFAIILAPTRELSKQISVVLGDLLRCANWLVSGTVLGGESKKSEKARLRKGLNILVATPGRLVDHLSNTKVLDVSSVRWLILDEGDRLMELGFEDDIRTIVEKLEEAPNGNASTPLDLPQRRITVLCSATMKMNVQRLGEISLKEAMHLQDKGGEDSKESGDQDHQAGFSAPAQLKQSFIVAPAKQRFVTLSALLKHTFFRKGSVMKAIVFFSCADAVEFHFTALGRQHAPDDKSEHNSDHTRSPANSRLETVYEALSIKSASNPFLKLYKLHGSLPQSTRTSTLATFSQSTDPSILLCTDVASRGLDLPSVDFVIEYDPAFSADDHLHRIGRTARAGKDGRATIFLLPGSEENYVKILEDGYKGEIGARVARQDADEVMKRGFSIIEGEASQRPKQAKHIWQEAATEFQLELERWVQSNPQAREMARKAYVSHVRAYATHVLSERHIFDLKNLHLGHLAKAFGLREAPGNMGRGTTADKAGARRQKSTNGTHIRDTRRSKDLDDDTNTVAADRSEAAAKMRKAMKAHMSAAGEFNIG